MKKKILQENDEENKDNDKDNNNLNCSCLVCTEVNTASKAKIGSNGSCAN